MKLLFGKLVQAASGRSTNLSDLATATAEVSKSSSTITGSATKGGIDVSTQTQSQSVDFQTMLTNLGTPITLKFGGLDWVVVYATTNTTTGVNTTQGDLIVTLWTIEDVIQYQQWSSFTSTDLSGDYPAVMYSSSMIRVKTLNAGGDNGEWAGNSGTDSTNKGTAYYATSTTSLGGSVTLANRKTNQFAKFTLSNNVLGTSSSKPSLAQFLTAPKNVEYQKDENWVWSCCEADRNPYLVANEAWDSPDATIRHTKLDKTGGWYTDPTSGAAVFPITQKNNYKDWSNDLLWLPSLTETGFCHTNATVGGSSLWGIPKKHKINYNSSGTTTTSNVACSWLRGAFYKSAESCRVSGLTSTGGHYGPDRDGNYITKNGGVRPALHLNLSAAMEAVETEISAPPATVTKEYLGRGQTLEEESWYKENIKVFGTSATNGTSFCEVTYTNDATKAVGIPCDAGTYTVTFKLLNDKYYWANDKTNKTKQVKFTITPKKLGVNFQLNSAGLPVLSFASGQGPYDADSGQVQLQIRYFDAGGTQDLGTDFNALPRGQSYTAKAELVGARSANYTLGTVAPLSFTISATRVKAEWMVTGSREYNGNAQNFTLLYSIGGENVSDVATAKLYKDYGDTVKKVNESRFTAINAGKYIVMLSLKDKSGEQVWDSTGTSADLAMEFEITPTTVTIPILEFTPPSKAVTVGYNMSANFELPPLVAGTLKVKLGAYYRGALFEELCTINLSTASIRHVEMELNTKTLDPNVTYELRLFNDETDLNAGNYNVVLSEAYEITVKEASLTGGISWRLLADGKIFDTQTDPADTNKITYQGSAIVYDGRLYSFTLNASGIGFEVDNAYSNDGFTNGYKTVKKETAQAHVSVKDAGTYVTTAFLRNGSETAEYSIEWTIDKAKFDLSNVRWLNDGKIVYNEKGMSVTLDPDTVPVGLTPSYDSVTPQNVGDKGTATVSFSVSDAKNYCLPVSTDSNSYLFHDESGSLSDFEWEKKWEVVRAQIPVSWTEKSITVGGTMINVKALAGGYDGYLDYVYFETDTAGAILDETKPLTEPEFVEGTVKYYVAKVAVKSGFAKSYLLNPEDEQYHTSPVFEVGHALKTVQLAAKKSEYIYWGKPIEFQYKVTEGTIVEDAFDITYYKGTLTLSGAPTDVGSYRAELTLKSDYTNSYSIDGASAFDFTIERAKINIVWNASTKPPALRLTAEQKTCVSYEYMDANGNAIGLGGLQVNQEYSVRGRIKADFTKNYMFSNNSLVTDWEQFTIKSGESIVDPGTASPLPPYDPNDSENPEYPAPEKIKVSLSLESASVEYDGTSRKVYIKNDGGLPQSAFVVTYSKNGETDAEHSAAGTYDVSVSLAEAYTDLYELTGTTDFIFTIVGAGGNGNGGNTGTPGGNGSGNGNGNGNGSGNDGATGDGSSDATFASYFPVILSGIALVLIVVFGVMTLNYHSATKAAKAKTKRLSQVTYSFAPLMAVVLGLSESNWWIVAGVLMGVALIMGIVAFVFRNKKQKALALLEEEEARIADEKAYADKEEARGEQARRDNEMRMMFAALQQNSQPQVQPINYEAIQGMITSTVSALLPAVQQIQALPPAQGDAEYYSRMGAETDELRKLMMQQQEQMAAQQAQMAQQQSRMAQQEELLSQILQNQQQAQQSYAVYEEEPVEDISWLGNNDELISLEESYGNLSDEEKRCYYEIGSYIMNKPRTSQNDGRYAVLFKYRKRTLFKLCIIGDAPVLYYPAEGGRAEIRIFGTTLELAKSIIDNCILKVDNGLA